MVTHRYKACNRDFRFRMTELMEEGVMKRLNEIKALAQTQRLHDKAKRVIQRAFGSRRAVHHYEYLD